MSISKIKAKIITPTCIRGGRTVPTITAVYEILSACNMVDVGHFPKSGVFEIHKTTIKKINNMEKSKSKALEFINNGGKCIYRYGWAYRGAGAKEISKEEALKLLPNYSFGKGFWELDWMTINGEIVLEFNELSENDMW